MSRLVKSEISKWRGERQNKWYELRQAIVEQKEGASITYYLKTGESVENARKIAYAVAKKYKFEVSVSLKQRGAIIVYRKGGTK